MANGRAIGRFEAALGVVGLLALGVTYSITTGWNPLPGVQNWLNRSQTLAEPAPAWTVRTGDQPTWAAGIGGVVVVADGGTVGGYAAGNGAPLWTHQVGWSAVAGSGAGAVVLTGQHRGYQALDPATGTARWSDPAAVGAWTFTDLVIGVACPQPVTCVLTGREPRTGTVRWEVGLPGDARPLGGANHALSGPRPLNRADPGPQPVPRLLGFPVDDRIEIVDTTAGTRPREYRTTPTTWVAAAGTRVLVSHGDYHHAVCTLSAEGRDPAGDRSVWRRPGYDTHTANATGCDQRTNPVGAAGLLDARSPDGRDVLLDPGTGDEVLRAGTNEKILDTDGRLVLVRTADKGTVRVVDLDGGATRWSRPAGAAGLALGPGVVVFTDLAAGRLTAVSAAGVVLADVASGATVLGFADGGVLVSVGRQVGLVRYAR